MSPLREINEPLPTVLAQAYPFRRRKLTLPDGHELHFIDEGEGPAVLMLHGNPTWSFYYRGLVQALRGRYRCIVPDHIGCGFSDKPQQGYPYRLERRVQDIACLVDTLQLAEVRLVVHDWGGAIGMGWATRHPAQVRQMVVSNTAAFFLNHLPLRIAACRWPVIGSFLVRGLNGFAGPATYMTTVKPLPKALRAAYLYPYRNWHDRVAIYRFVQDIPWEAAHPSRPELSRIEDGLAALRQVPLALHWGMQDWCFTPDFLKRWQAFFTAAAVHTYDQAGHYLLEDAGPAVAERVAAFFDQAGESR